MPSGTPRSQRYAWRIKAASVPGHSHRQSHQPCQDHHCWRIIDGHILIAAVADGAGSAKFGGHGAEIATHTAVDRLAWRLRASGPSEFVWREAFYHALAGARETVAAEAERNGTRLADYRTTLMLLAASSSLVGKIQVGDGATVVANAQGDLFSLTKPKPEEYFNETTFLNSSNSLASAEITFWHQRTAHVAMFSDGLQLLALKMPECQPHRPFFLPLWDFADRDMETQTAENELSAFLSSPRIASRTEDDLTLVLASLVNDAGAQEM